MDINNNTTTLLQQLLEGIRKPLLFFIPSAFLSNLENSGAFTDKDSIRVVDSIVILNIDGSVKYIESGFYQITLLEKEAILNNNIFILLQQESTLNDKAFEYVLDKYTKELLAWVEYTQMMIEYIKDATSANLIDNYYPELLPFFVLQHNLLKQHKNNYLNHFNELLNALNLNITSNDDNKNNIVAKNNTVAQILNVKPIEVEESDALFSTQEIDSYLLEYIFNIDLKPS